MARMALQGEYDPSPHQRVRDQVEEYESSDGARGNTMHGLPVVILTTRGARSGRVRKAPLMRVEHDGSYAVVASLGGAPQHPSWYYNVRTNPEVELQDGSERHEYLARELTGEEKAQWWERAVEAFPDYATYQRRTSREIPVFVLERVA